MSDRIIMTWRWITGRCVSCGDSTPFEVWPPRRVHCPGCKEVIAVLAEGSADA